MKSQLNHMNAERKLIKAYLEELKQASNIENLPEIIEFENEVFKHATIEEEIFFSGTNSNRGIFKIKISNKTIADFIFCFGSCGFISFCSAFLSARMDLNTNYFMTSQALIMCRRVPYNFFCLTFLFSYPAAVAFRSKKTY